ncbi:MAG: hypothetical protein AB7F36_03815 [Reyranellaceae bacterium]
MRLVAVLCGILLILPGLCFVGVGIAGFIDGGWLMVGFGAVLLSFAYLLVREPGSGDDRGP